MNRITTLKTTLAGIRWLVFLFVESFPVNDGVRAIGEGPGLGATQLLEPNGSYIASSEGALQPIDVDLAIELVLQTPGKAQQEDARTITQTTFLRVGGVNPGASVARIEMGLEKRVRVTLEVYSVAGRRVRRLADGPMDAGIHALDWDGRDENGEVVAAGVYIAKLKADDKLLTQKLVLMR